MTVRRIVTEQAPSAKPIGVAVRVTTDWQTVIDVPEYDVPVIGFGTARRIAPGVAEISSPMLVSNRQTSSARISVRLIRGLRSLVNSQTQASYAIFSGGEGHASSDSITLINGATVSVDAVDAEGTVTEFTITSVGSEVLVGDTLTQAFTDGLGVDFSITIGEVNQNLSAATFTLVNELPVEPFDTFVIPFNGQFFSTGDLLQVQADSNNFLDALISYTEGQAEEDDLPLGE